MIAHWLNRTLQLWRPESTPDGYGGEDVTYVRQPDDVRAKVDQPSTGDQLLAAQTRSKHSHDVFLLPDADVRRLDELRDEATGESFKVLAVIGPSSPIYRKAQAQLIQGEGEPDG
ncbi:phage head completion protein [Streptomyces scabiei]|uniref:phage head completion protein n=1 Tax=Streptomyces scabiei TaxID=1930 RepID=UPI00076590C0|nr:head-tail adaptor protein [Streptomyces scabiei]